LADKETPSPSQTLSVSWFTIKSKEGKTVIKMESFAVQKETPVPAETCK
jgi:hypothetical protein